jgi:lipid II:glycine glycyltransferase (peptidoglycan interpeptide bridge formation enzyme)
MLYRPFPLRAGRMAYVGFGPLTIDPASEQALWTAIDRRMRQRGVTFLRWEPGIYQADEPQPDPAAHGFRPASETIQPPRTILIDLSPVEEAILARMNQGTRRKIRQALKSDIHYTNGTQADVAKFTSIMAITGSRNAFGVHSPAYYEQAFALFAPGGDGALILAEHEGDTLAGVMVFALGETAWYLYGASSSVKRNLMASYGAQWEAIRWAKARGCRVYDMWGIPDEDEAALEAGFQEREDGLWGVYGFKRGWGGQVIRSLGAWDRIYKPLIYRAYQMAVRARG